MVSMQNLGTYATILVIVPMLAALLSMQALQGMDLGYLTNLTWALMGYCLLILVLIYFLFRKVKEGFFARGLMAGVLYGFINAAIASIANGIPILYEILSVPPELARPAGLDTSNPILYTASFIVFWVIVFGAAGRIMESHGHGSRKTRELGQE